MEKKVKIVYTWLKLRVECVCRASERAGVRMVVAAAHAYISKPPYDSDRWCVSLSKSRWMCDIVSSKLGLCADSATRSNLE